MEGQRTRDGKTNRKQPRAAMEGALADKSSQLVVDSLRRAMACPTGMPLIGARGEALFTSSASARQAADDCKEQDLLRVVRTEPRGKSVQEIVALTNKGFHVVLHQAGAKQVLDDLVRAVEARERQLAELVAGARETQAALDGLRQVAARVLEHLGQGEGASSDPTPEALAGKIVLRLEEWHASEPAKDCPLPELYARTRACSVGGFHDALRLLHEQRQIYLHPWTGPLYSMPEPPLALLVGHEVAYYASLRR